MTATFTIEVDAAQLARMLALGMIEPKAAQDRFGEAMTLEAILLADDAGPAAKPEAPKEMPRTRGEGRNAKRAAGEKPGQAPHGDTPRQTHSVRIAALEAAIPGIKAKSLSIASIGTLAGQRARTGRNEFALMDPDKNPWTWIELPMVSNLGHGMPEAIGEMSGEDVRDKLWSLGYGWSSTNVAYVTKANGQPGGGTRTRSVKAYRGAKDDE